MTEKRILELESVEFNWEWHYISSNEQFEILG